MFSFCLLFFLEARFSDLLKLLFWDANRKGNLSDFGLCSYSTSDAGPQESIPRLRLIGWNGMER